MAISKKTWELFLISVISLFVELLVIRWLSSEIRIFAYFKNIPLMATLFGLGLGLALSNNKKDLSWMYPVGLIILSVLIGFAEPLHLVHVTCINPVEHYLIGTNTEGFSGNVSYWDKAMLVIPGLLVLVSVFYVIVCTFMSIGQKLGVLFDSFKPLTAYSINVGASFIGIALFTIMSYMSLKPEIWLSAGVLMSVWFWRKPWQIAVLVACAAVAFITSKADVIWSPYYRVSVREAWIPADGAKPQFFYGHTVDVNHDAIEGAYDHRAETFAKATAKQRESMLDYYDLLYQLIGEKPRSVLILAAGAGNDLAAALRHGATKIDAVEIDPTIVSLGRKLHPEKPYENPAVHIVVDDARAFLKQTKEKYDLVDFAYLDSHSAFSSMSSIRLDNYIYTLESFREASKLMKPDGIMAVTFYATTSWQTTRLFKTITEAMGEEPIGVWSSNKSALQFLVGPGVDREKIKATAEAAGLKLFDKEENKKLNASELANWDNINVTTDDWPYLFLRERGMTITYAAGLIFTLCIGWRLVRRCFGAYTVNPLGRTMFYLGAAFMLVEVKSVSQMGLLAGTTWLVNSAVIGAILLMILIANLCQMRLKVQNPKNLYMLLFVALLGSYFMPLSLFNTMGMFERLSLGGLVLALPIFFASWIFAITFSKVDVPHNALGMNLLGTLVGGALEYFSMVLGISALNLVALALYGLAFFYWRKVPLTSEGTIDTSTAAAGGTEPVATDASPSPGQTAGPDGSPEPGLNPG